MRKIFLFVLMFTFSWSLSAEANECTANDNEIYAFNMVEDAYVSNESKNTSAECRAVDPEELKKEMAKPLVKKEIDKIIKNDEYVQFICASAIDNEGVGSVERETGLQYSLYMIKGEERLIFDPKVEHIVHQVKCEAAEINAHFSLIGRGLQRTNRIFLHSIMKYIDEKDVMYRKYCAGKVDQKNKNKVGPWGDYFFNPIDASGKRVYSVLDTFVELNVNLRSYPNISTLHRELFNDIKGRGGKCSPKIEAQKKYKKLCQRGLFKL